MNYKKTLIACLSSYVVQAIIVNLAPLLFLTFQKSFGISFSAVSLLITVNFCVQLTVDLICAKYVDKIGHRAAMIFGHTAATIGLICMAVLPSIFPNPYIALVLSTMIYAIGGGIIEVLVSPLVEACPTKNKEGTMSLLHSFYSWGQVMVTILTCLFFAVFGIENWRILTLIWALVPTFLAVIFIKLPLPAITAEGEVGLSLGQLFKKGLFWLLLLLMLCSGASEQGVIQWASVFAEKTLGLSKSVGDLVGPLTFAILMGLCRTLFARYSEKIPLEKFIIFSSFLCVAGYLITVFSNSTILSLLGFALCGFSVGIMWPGTLSVGAAGIRGGGTAMFAMFAVAGDIGCSAGPTIVGFFADIFGGDLKVGLLVGTIFPAILIVGTLAKRVFFKPSAPSQD